MFLSKLAIAQHELIPERSFATIFSPDGQTTEMDTFPVQSVHKKAEVLQKMLNDALDTFLPITNIKFTSDDAPWVSKEVKDLDPARKKEFVKHHKSDN